MKNALFYMFLTTQNALFYKFRDFRMPYFTYFRVFRTPYFTSFRILECLILHISEYSERLILQNILFNFLRPINRGNDRCLAIALPERLSDHQEIRTDVSGIYAGNSKQGGTRRTAQLILVSLVNSTRPERAEAPSPGQRLG